MAATLAQAGQKLGGLLDSKTIQAMARAAGKAAKEEVEDAAGKALGGDRAMSGFKRRRPLKSGYDIVGSAVVVNFRPAGLWVLADRGRRGSKRRRVVAGQGRRAGAGSVRAFMTPHGPRRSFRSGPSRGLHVYDKAVRGAERMAPKAAEKELRRRIARSF